MIHILVLEDDAKLNQAVCTYLNDSGFSAKGCLSAHAAYDELYNHLYDLIVSDIMMPEVDGFEFAETVRQVNKTIPILFMSAKDDLPSKQKGFLLGIDDYMVKPLDLSEFRLRVRALFRRAKIQAEKQVAVGGVIANAADHTVRYGAERISLPRKEFELLFMLMSYPDMILTRRQLMDEIWGVDCDTGERTVDVHVKRLREKVENVSDQWALKTVWGVGYKFEVK